MINRIVSKISLAILLLFSMTSCEMGLQEDHDYDSSVLDPNINMTAWEYFESRTDLFTIYMDAIEYAEMKDYFTQIDTKYTFLALTDKAMSSFITTFPGVDSIGEVDKESVVNLIKYHIVDGEYSSYGQLDVEPMFVPTLRDGESGLMTMLVRKNPWQNDAGKVVVNDSGSNSNSLMRSAVSSNIKPTNGVIHVFESYSYYKK